MKCPEFNKLIDLIDNKLSKAEAHKIEAHINTCANCTEQAEWARRTLSSMKSSILVDAPEYVIQKALSVFPNKKVKIADWIIAKLSFDSWMVPEMAGVRSENTGPRQRIYQTDSYKIILMTEPERWIGQLVSDHPDVETAGCLIELISGKKLLATTVTNRNGEFMIAPFTGKKLELKIHGQPEAVLICDLANLTTR